MPTVVKLEMSGVNEILRERNLEPGGIAQQHLTNSCAKHMADYMPYREGVLIKKMQTGILPEEGKIVIDESRARFLYYGKLMIGIISGSAYAHENEQKKAVDKDLTYNTAKNALAGPLWDKRMWEDKGAGILEDLSKITGGQVK